MEGISEALELVSSNPYDIKNYPKCIKLCSEQDAATSNDTDEHSIAVGVDEGGALAAEVRGMMVSAVGATSSEFVRL